jgi:hypothetical protein
LLGAKKSDHKLISLVSISRFDGRALLDFIRDSSSRPFRVQEKSEEEEELEEFVNFERYRDLIKHHHRGCRYLFEFSLLFFFYIGIGWLVSIYTAYGIPLLHF